MTTDELSDGYKGAVHLAVFGMAAAMLLWNAGRWGVTHQPVHGMNALAYLGLVAFEAQQIRVHWSPETE